MDEVTTGTDPLGRSSASPTPQAPSVWADAVARYLEAPRLTHYTADTVHIHTLYLRYFAAWATRQGITKPEDVTRADVERYQRWLDHCRKRAGGPLSVSSMAVDLQRCMYEDIADMSHPPVHAVDMVRAVKR